VLADVEGFLTLERGYEGASDVQHVAHKAVFDATAEALRAELAPVRASCAGTRVMVWCPGQPCEQQIMDPMRKRPIHHFCLLIEDAWQLNVCASWLFERVRRNAVRATSVQASAYHPSFLATAKTLTSK
jgi:hypothetical protein